MRLTPVLVVALAALAVAAGPAVAHEGEGVAHVNPHYGTLAPGEWELNALEYEDGDLREGWVFILNIALNASGAPVHATLVTDDTTVAEWDVPADGQVHRLTAMIPTTAAYAVNISHAGDSDLDAQYAYFFDQSCECAGKPIPHTLLGGVIVFNADVPANDEIYALFPEPSALGLKITAAWRTGDGTEWPADYEVLEVSESPDRITETGARLHEMNLSTGDGGRLYWWVEANAFHAQNFAGPSSVMVAPFFELQSTVDKDVDEQQNGAAGPGAVLGIAGGLVAALALASRYRRR